MSPTSYRTALPRDMNYAGDRARTGTGSLPRDFKSRVSANSTTPAKANLLTARDSIAPLPLPVKHFFLHRKYRPKPPTFDGLGLFSAICFQLFQIVLFPSLRSKGHFTGVFQQPQDLPSITAPLFHSSEILPVQVCAAHRPVVRVQADRQPRRQIGLQRMALVWKLLVGHISTPTPSFRHRSISWASSRMAMP